ncbi:hypothetical protein SLEP1_g44812 [Rubroshorea leprosula]|uniref:Uncharacterized protein n=1 Tax=Rubroshorea leprosula TaxID=152421 RepID=A0AAV5LJ28_9ROSI|nr:hypothetical protein SLEP1_g44812 [Rubroshorea leprosula]
MLGLINVGACLFWGDPGFMLDICVIVGFDVRKCLDLQKVKANEEEEEVVAGFDFKPSTPVAFNQPSDYQDLKKPNCAGFL